LPAQAQSAAEIHKTTNNLAFIEKSRTISADWLSSLL
jgi:hypothetical protein